MAPPPKPRLPDDRPYHPRADYEALADWCRSRRGQVIVCENVGADWLPFEPFITIKANESKSGGKVSREAIWTNGGEMQCGVTSLHARESPWGSQT